MKTVGIIAEFNPFHNGHKYLIEKAKEETNADRVIVIMSGNFTQQGNIAVIDKFKRAEIATNYGVDLVIELPTIYAVSSAETFAKGAIDILDKLNIVDYLAFGTEAASLSTLQSIASKILDNENLLSEKIKENLKSGITYALARDKALKEILTTSEYAEISSPNNILAIEYLKELLKIKSNIVPVAIKRANANHNDTSIYTNSFFASATSLRNHLENMENSVLDIENYVPNLTYKALLDSKLLFNNDIYTLLRYIITIADNKKLSSIYEISEGLENKIKESATTSLSYFELLNNVKSKRYTLSRIKRIFTHILLELTSDLFCELNGVNYARVLKVTDKSLLSKLSRKSTIPVISNINEKVLKSLDAKTYESLMLDFKADNIYSIIANDSLNKDRTNKI